MGTRPNGQRPSHGESVIMADSGNTSFTSEYGSNHTDSRALVLQSQGQNHVGSNHVGAGSVKSFHSSTEVSVRQVLTKRRRLVEKSGHLNVEFDTKVTHWWIKFVKDVFTTSVDMPWRYNIIMVCLGFLVSWLIFAGIYYAIAWGRGDFDHLNNAEHTPCFRNFYNWRSALLYSIEAQTTIGFGFRCPTEECIEAIIILVIQVLLANFLEAFIIGAFIAKFSRPKMRANTLIFSKTACITKQDGQLCFLFRVGDLRANSPIVEGHMRLQLIKHYVTQEGAWLPYKIFDLNIGHEFGMDRVFLVWPLAICHVIDKRSPLYNLSKEGLDGAEFEIVAILEGIVASTGTTTQARTSYLPDEIAWGHDFENIIFENEGTHYVDFERFHHTQEVPSFQGMSARETDEEMRQQNPSGQGDGPIWTERKESACSTTSTPIKKTSSFRRSRQMEMESRL
ncbi:G protein-activated inward rectifier potassium channel 3-like [Diadema antillarum]|uniref:G protein-activated inward rectifier potassium channel 3-like n=1 Tax=Diadema antillarum TaxID=105358 RepID=UPI003A894BF5